MRQIYTVCITDRQFTQGKLLWVIWHCQCSLSCDNTAICPLWLVLISRHQGSSQYETKALANWETLIVDLSSHRCRNYQDDAQHILVSWICLGIKTKSNASLRDTDKFLAIEATIHSRLCRARKSFREIFWQ